jgi:hypothetical protein
MNGRNSFRRHRTCLGFRQDRSLLFSTVDRRLRAVLVNRKPPVGEAGIANLTKDEATMPADFPKYNPQ